MAAILTSTSASAGAKAQATDTVRTFLVRRPDFALQPALRTLFEATGDQQAVWASGDATGSPHVVG
ncbi:hypothetical protein ABZ816_34170 [Actinosynnema sp. NPDC047251]|uniref:hypothetical protein n=1 Tax=Saccharothrix espanaensis TaxID=103731 RepID=UPI0002F3F43D|nr:hypothetical protein [Saccharothrix espanaensis]